MTLDRLLDQLRKNRTGIPARATDAERNAWPRIRITFTRRYKTTKPLTATTAQKRLQIVGKWQDRLDGTFTEAT